jgi:hypothetical protein
MAESTTGAGSINPLIGTHLEIPQETKNELRDLVNGTALSLLEIGAGNQCLIGRAGPQAQTTDLTRLLVDTQGRVACTGNLELAHKSIRHAKDINKSMGAIRNLATNLPHCTVLVRGREGEENKTFELYREDNVTFIVGKNSKQQLPSLMIPDIINDTHPIVFNGDEKALQAMNNFRGIQLARENPTIESEITPKLANAIHKALSPKPPPNYLGKLFGRESKKAPEPEVSKKELAPGKHIQIPETDYIIAKTRAGFVIQSLVDWGGQQKSGIFIPDTVSDERRCTFDGDKGLLNALESFVGLGHGAELGAGGGVTVNPVSEKIVSDLRDFARELSDDFTEIKGTDYIILKTESGLVVQKKSDWHNELKRGLFISASQCIFDGDKKLIEALEGFLYPGPLFSKGLAEESFASRATLIPAEIRHLLGLSTECNIEDPVRIEDLDFSRIDPELREFLQELEFHSGGESSKCKGNNLLGRFDVVQHPCKMSQNNLWEDNSKEGQNAFYLSDAAALNIGEGYRDGKEYVLKAEDFNDYKNADGTLNEALYIESMGQIFSNILAAQASKVADAVWFPFGMGAFLRQLKVKDPAYDTFGKMDELRDKIAEKFVEEASKFPELKIHMCLPETPEGEMNPEMTANFNAFANAVNKPGLGSNITIYPNVDATALAQKMANEKGPKTVALTNGANRNQFANIFLSTVGARLAIDENLHRRSSIAAATAYLLNAGFSQRVRSPGELEARIRLIKARAAEATAAEATAAEATAAEAAADRKLARDGIYAAMEKFERFRPEIGAEDKVLTLGDYEVVISAKPIIMTEIHDKRSAEENAANTTYYKKRVLFILDPVAGKYLHINSNPHSDFERIPSSSEKISDKELTEAFEMLKEFSP